MRPSGYVVGCCYGAKRGLHVCPTSSRIDCDAEEKLLMLDISAGSTNSTKKSMFSFGMAAKPTMTHGAPMTWKITRNPGDMRHHLSHESCLAVLATCEAELACVFGFAVLVTCDHCYQIHQNLNPQVICHHDMPKHDWLHLLWLHRTGNIVDRRVCTHVALPESPAVCN